MHPSHVDSMAMEATAVDSEALPRKTMHSLVTMIVLDFVALRKATHPLTIESMVMEVMAVLVLIAPPQATHPQRHCHCSKSICTTPHLHQFQRKNLAHLRIYLSAVETYGMEQSWSYQINSNTGVPSISSQQLKLSCSAEVIALSTVYQSKSLMIFE